MNQLQQLMVDKVEEVTKSWSEKYNFNKPADDENAKAKKLGLICAKLGCNANVAAELVSEITNLKVVVPDRKKGSSLSVNKFVAIHLDFGDDEDSYLSGQHSILIMSDEMVGGLLKDGSVIDAENAISITRERVRPCTREEIEELIVGNF